MATSTVQVRELMGPNQFAKRREMFDKYDSVFTPPNNSSHLRHSESSYGKPVLVSNQKNSAGFQRNTSYSSFQEPRSSASEYYQRRKWSDVQNPEYLDEGVVVRAKYYGDIPRSHSSSDYSQNLRRQRLSKLRSEFLASNLHSPEDVTKPFQRFGTRASLPAQRGAQYKALPHIYKFPFAEPYSTPPAIRKIHLDFNTPIKKVNTVTNQTKKSVEVPSDVESEIDEKLDVSGNNVTDATPMVVEQSPIMVNSPTTPDNNNFKERFDKLRSEYAPYVSPTNLMEKLPPTKPRIIDITPKELNYADSQADHTDSLPNTSNDGIAQKAEAGTSEMPTIIENVAVASAVYEETEEPIRAKPVNNVTTHSHQRSPSDIPKDSTKPVQPHRRNTEDNTNKNTPFTKPKKRNFFQRLFLLKNKKDK